MPERKLESRLVAWCPDCLHWVGDYEGPGDPCPADCGLILVKRRMWVCSVSDCRQAYVALGDAVQHDCYSAY